MINSRELNVFLIKMIYRKNIVTTGGWTRDGKGRTLAFGDVCYWTKDGKPPFAWRMWTDDWSVSFWNAYYENTAEAVISGDEAKFWAYIVELKLSEE